MDLCPCLRDGRRAADLTSRFGENPKRYLLAAAAHNIGVLMRKLFQMGTPRGLQECVEDLSGSARAVYLVCLATRAGAHFG
jgi:hypothetical protein